MKKLSKTFKLRVLKKVLSVLKSLKLDYERKRQANLWAVDNINFEGICDIIWEVTERSKEYYILEDMCKGVDFEIIPVVKLFGIEKPKKAYSRWGYYWPLTNEGNNQRIRVIQRAIKRIENG